MSEWKEYKLGDVIKVSQGLAINSKTNYLLQKTGLPLLRITDLLNNTQVQFVNPNEVPIQCIANKNEIIYTRTGQVGYVFKGKVGVVHNNCFKVTPLSDSLDSNFLYWFLYQKSVREHANTIASGSVQKDLTHSAFKSIPISIPSLPTQTAIAEILSSLDDKIELNNAINKNLEDLAQALFKQWFVDFEYPDENGQPYKSSGGEMVESELGEIPKGWKVDKLGVFIKFLKGKKPKSLFEKYENDLVPQILIDTLDGGKPLFTKREKMVISSERDIIMVMDGASSGRVETGFSGSVGSTLAIIEIKEISQSYMFQFLKLKEKDIKENTTGAAIPHADKAKINDYDLVLPQPKIIELFSNVADDIMDSINNNKQESSQLKILRDTLLPKLISGELEVNEALLQTEKVV